MRKASKRSGGKAVLIGTALFVLSAILAGCYVVAGHPPRGHRPAVVVAPGPPGPPAVVITSRPRLVFMADFGIHVAPDLEVSLFFDDHSWFYFHSGTWYTGPSYNGPWVVAKGKRLPPGLTRVPPGQLKKMAQGKGGRGGKGKNKKHR